MVDFALVDLASQARAVALHLRGLSFSAKLAWLRQRGEIYAVRITPDGYHGWFRSVVGVCVAFSLSKDGTLYIIYADTFDTIDPLEREIFTIGWDWRGARSPDS